MIKILYHEEDGINGKKAYPEVVNSLVYIYRKNDRNFDAEIVLSDWVLRNPKDTNAQEILEQIRSGKK